MVLSTSERPQAGRLILTGLRASNRVNAGPLDRFARDARLLDAADRCGCRTGGPLLFGRKATAVGLSRATTASRLAVWIRRVGDVRR